MIVEDLKKSIYLSAFKGELSKRDINDSNVNECINNVINKYNIDQKEIKKRKINDICDIKYELPETWKWVKLGFLGDVIRGLTFSNSTSKSSDDNVLVLRGGNIDSSTEKLLYIDNIYVDKSIPNEKQYLQNGDTLIVASSGTKTSVGKSAFIDDIDDNVSFGGFMMTIRAYKEIINPKYLSYNIKLYRNKIINGTAGYISNVTNGILNNLMIPLPPIEEQQRIVNRVDKIFLELDELKLIEEKLLKLKTNFPNEMRNSILKYFYDGSNSSMNIENWQNDSIYNICSGEVCTGNSISESIKNSRYLGCKNGYNYIATKDLQFNHTFNYENGIKIPLDEEKFKYANKDDILMCIEGGSAGKKIGLLEEKVCYGNKLCKFSPKLVEPKYLFYYLQSPQFLNNFNDNMTGIIGGVSINKIKKIEIKYPSLDEQKRIVEKIEQLLPLCDDIEQLVNE